MPSKRVLRIALAAAMLAATSCSSNGITRIAGSGMVEQAGKPVSHAIISFQSEHGPGTNGEIVDGYYQFTSSDGPVPGPNSVIIELMIVDKFAPQTSQRWELEFEVPAEGPFEKNFELTDNEGA